MVNPFIVCGSHSFPREDEDELNDQQRQVKSAGSSPLRPSKRRTTRSSSSRSSNNSHKNLYSDRGLDKFSALLADIEEKREKIYSQFAPEEISLVRFDFSEGNNMKPIVVKAKPHEEVDQAQNNNNKNNKKKSSCNKPTSTTPDHHRKHHSGPLDRHGRQTQPTLTATPKEKTTTTPTIETETHHEEKKSSSSSSSSSCDQLMKIQNLPLENLQKPGCYLSATLIIVLIFLAFFGRSAAIMCTSIGWYMMSTVNNNLPDQRRSPKKKALHLGSSTNTTTTTTTAQVGQHHVNSRLSSAPASFKGRLQTKSPSPPRDRPAVKCGMRKNR